MNPLVIVPECILETYFVLSTGGYHGLPVGLATQNGSGSVTGASVLCVCQLRCHRDIDTTEIVFKSLHQPLEKSWNLFFDERFPVEITLYNGIFIAILPRVLYHSYTQSIRKMTFKGQKSVNVFLPKVHSIDASFGFPCSVISTNKNLSNQLQRNLIECQKRKKDFPCLFFW